MHILTSATSRFRITTCIRKHCAKKENDDDRPVKFSTSGASRWRAEVSRSGIGTSRLWYEPYVILASLAVFLIYFGILREENDYDLELSKTLYSRIEGLEEEQLRQSLEYNRLHGLETTDIIKRLQELQAKK